MGLSASDIKEKARTLGFERTGIAPIGPFPESAFYPEWLAQGYAGEMTYLERQTPGRLDPSLVLPGVRSVIVCAMNYNTDRPRTFFDKTRAWVSRYAWGLDYHVTIQTKLREFAGWIEASGSGHTRAYVDTGPLIERVFAKYAGVGWFGKNTCIIDEKLGSCFFLGCILTDIELAPDTP